jgi:hypothetical protein
MECCLQSTKPAVHAISGSGPGCFRAINLPTPPLTPQSLSRLLLGLLSYLTAPKGQPSVKYLFDLFLGKTDTRHAVYLPPRDFSFHHGSTTLTTCITNPPHNNILHAYRLTCCTTPQLVETMMFSIPAYGFRRACKAGGIGDIPHRSPLRQ